MNLNLNRMARSLRFTQPTHCTSRNNHRLGNAAGMTFSHDATVATDSILNSLLHVLLNPKLSSLCQRLHIMIDQNVWSFLQCCCLRCWSAKHVTDIPTEFLLWAAYRNSGNR